MMAGCSSLSPVTSRISLKRDWSLVEGVGWLMQLVSIGGGGHVEILLTFPLVRHIFSYSALVCDSLLVDC